MAFCWDSSKCAATITLSNSDRTATASTSNTQRSVISDWSKSSGKIYWEIEVDAVGSEYASYGVCDQDTGTDFSSLIRSGYNESWALMDFGSSARAYHDGSYSSFAGVTIQTGDVLMFALDLDNHKLWVGKNNSWFNSGDPAAGTGEIFSDADIDAVISACLTPCYENDAFTSCFKSSELNYTAPTGFSAPDFGEAGISEGLGLDSTAIVHGHPPSSGDGLGLSETIGANTERQKGISETLGLSCAAGSLGLPQMSGQGLGVADAIGADVERNRGNAEGFGISEAIGRQVEFVRGISEGLGLADAVGGSNYTQWVADNQDRVVYRFYGTLTGEGDGLADYDLPGMRNFQFRARSGDASYLGIVIPYSASALSAISARQNGRLIVEMVAVVDGAESLRETLIETDFYSVRYDRGSRNRSISVVGYRTQTYGGQRVTLENIDTETMLADGRMQYRCARPDWYLKPGDTAVNGSDEITVGTINCIIGPIRQYMEVQEVAA